jgi:2,3-bisphosphoglycerate-independent phosphoglycerate mutase
MLTKRTVPPFVLVILDGFGYRKDKDNNAVALAKTPTLDHLLQEYPHTLLQASGSAVGLPEGFVGNSEVGHLTIGAGRIVVQNLTIINNAITDGSFFSDNHLQHFLDECVKSRKTLHIMGLLSDAGIHSDTKHMYAFLDAAQRYGIKNIILHLFLDGRDTAPKSAHKYLQKVDAYIKKHPHVRLGSIHGRYYAMDRDRHWQRTEECFKACTEPQEIQFTNWETAITHYYNTGITDEFIPSTQFSHTTLIHPDDFIIFFNFRPDRARQLLTRLTQIDGISILTPVHLNHFTGKTSYIFDEPSIKHTLKDVLNAHKKTMLSIAETEKYAHVTYFFNGGAERILPYETRILVPSIPVKTYANLPNMSAEGITRSAVQSLRGLPCDFYLINYANPDMVGHSGNLEATIKAIEFLDTQLEILYNVVVKEMKGTLIITADHGNAEDMYDPVAQQPRTSHTTNPVPFIVIKKDLKNSGMHLDLTGLKDIAPFILHMMSLPVPHEMEE